MILRKGQETQIEKESTRSHSVEYLLWKRLWTYHKKGHRMMMMMMMILMMMMMMMMMMMTTTAMTTTTTK
jgi:maltodextrin utilization protein YvdJ